MVSWKLAVAWAVQAVLLLEKRKGTATIDFQVCRVAGTTSDAFCKVTVFEWLIPILILSLMERSSKRVSLLGEPEMPAHALLHTFISRFRNRGIAGSSLSIRTAGMARKQTVTGRPVTRTDVFRQLANQTSTSTCGRTSLLFGLHHLPPLRLANPLISRSREMDLTKT